MHGMSMVHNSGAYVTTRSLSFASAVAGGAGDGVEVVSRWISHSDFFSAKAVVAARATLAAGETLTLSGLAVEHALDEAGTAAAELLAEMGDLILTGQPGGSSEYGTYELDVDLGGSKGFIRLRFLPELSAADTDTAELAGILILGGSTDLPAK